MFQHQVGAPVPASGHGGLSSGAIVLLWVFAGWPLSWILLFLFPPLGLLFGIGITIWMIVAVAQASPGRGAPGVVVNVGAMPGTSPTPQRPGDPAVRRRVESLACITALGGCGWCGSGAAHVTDTGHPVHPRHWHDAEIEECIRTRTLGG